MSLSADNALQEASNGMSKCTHIVPVLNGYSLQKEDKSTDLRGDIKVIISCADITIMHMLEMSMACHHTFIVPSPGPNPMHRTNTDI